jgi:hypothetical protein
MSTISFRDEANVQFGGSAQSQVLGTATAVAAGASGVYMYGGAPRPTFPDPGRSLNMNDLCLPHMCALIAQPTYNTKDIINLQTTPDIVNRSEEQENLLEKCVQELSSGSGLNTVVDCSTVNEKDVRGGAIAAHNQRKPFQFSKKDLQVRTVQQNLSTGLSANCSYHPFPLAPVPVSPRD